jgi:N-acetylglucosamine kinase-like BadF-type ATPase
MDKLALLGSSWSKIASPYRDHFVPRFLPWIQDSINALLAHKLDPKGVIFVPGCGTGNIIFRSLLDIGGDRIKVTIKTTLPP